MKRSTVQHAGQALTALSVLATAWCLARLATHSDGAPTGFGDDNPQKFHLWTTGSNFFYTFTCDPHASDVWMFRTADGTMLVLPAPPGNLPLSTNPQIGR